MTNTSQVYLARARKQKLKEAMEILRALGFAPKQSSFLSQISWESEVWVADGPDHMIHFNGERFLGPYPDVE